MRRRIPAAITIHRVPLRIVVVARYEDVPIFTAIPRVELRLRSVEASVSDRQTRATRTLLGEDGDDSRRRISSVQRRSGPSDDFDPVNVVQWDDLVRRPASKRYVPDGNTIDQQERARVVPVFGSSYPDHVPPIPAPQHLNPHRHLEQVGQRPCSGLLDLCR